MNKPVQSGAPGAERLENLDILRGLAALAVACFHMSITGLLNGVPPLGQMAARGYLGVDVFFVISGFVIPLALYKEGFVANRLPFFLWRRFLRLYPAYIASCVLVVVLWYLSMLAPGFKGQGPDYEWPRILGNILLTCGFQGELWINVVAWTLAIEAQYYLLIGLSFPLLCSEKLQVRLAMVCIWIGLPLLQAPASFICMYSPLFACGILLFMERRQLLSRGMAVGLLCLALVVEGFAESWWAAGAGLVAVLWIAFMPALKVRPLVWLGVISYSLYLVHVPVGGRVINLAGRLEMGGALSWLAVPAACVVSLLVAWVFYLFIEKPSHRWASRAGRK